MKKKLHKSAFWYLNVTRGRDKYTLPKGTGGSGEALTETNRNQVAQKLEESGMKVISHVASPICLYLVVQKWSFLWRIHFLLPIGMVVAVLAVGMVLTVTVEDRKKARIDRVFGEKCDQYDREQRLKGD